AEGVELVAVVLARARAGGAGVPALEAVVAAARFPAVAAGRARVAAVAFEGGGDLRVVAARVVLRVAEEVAEPVLFTGDQRAPGRLAGAAVVDRAARLGAVGAVLRAQVRAAGGGA